MSSAQTWLARRDGQLAQQVGVDLVARVALAGARLRAQRLDAHALHERAHVAPPDMNALALQLAAQHASAHEGMLQVQLIDAAHECQVGSHWWVGAGSTPAPRLMLQQAGPGARCSEWCSRSIIALRSAIPPW